MKFKERVIYNKLFKMNYAFLQPLNQLRACKNHMSYQFGTEGLIYCNYAGVFSCGKIRRILKLTGIRLFI